MVMEFEVEKRTMAPGEGGINSEDIEKAMKKISFDSGNNE